MRQTELSGLGSVADQAIHQLVLGGVLAEVDEHRGGVAVEHRHANALRRDAQRPVERHDLALRGVHMAEHLQRFLLAFGLLAGDERDDVAHHLGPILEGLARAGNRLIGAHHHLARLELPPRGQRRRVGLNRAVRLDGDETARGAQALLLVGDHVEMLRIDFRHHHRHVRRPAVRAVVGDDRRFGFGVFLFDGANLVLRHVHRAKQKIDAGGHIGHIGHVLNNHALDELGHRRLHFPAAADGLLVGLAGAVRGSGEGGQLEPRVVFQQRDETLADHAGGAENADFQFFGHNNLLFVGW